MVALVPMGGVLYFVAFVNREQVKRAIGLRRANRSEVNHYVRAIKADQAQNADT